MEKEEKSLEDSIAEIIDEKYDHMVATNQKKWEFSPQTFSGYIAVITILIGAAWTFSDFRVSINDIITRQNLLSERIIGAEKRISDLDTNGSRNLLGINPTIKNLQDQVDDLKEATKDLNSSLLQHNEAMMDLYRKDVSDGKRDFKIPKNAPKYHLNSLEPDKSFGLTSRGQ